MKNFLAFTTIVVLLLTGLAGGIHAMKYKQGATFGPENAKSADLIFEGRALSETPDDTLESGYKYSFSVQRTWKADLASGAPNVENVDIYLSKTWGDGFEVGQEYLVIARKAEAGVFISDDLDSPYGSRALSDAGDAQQILRQIYGPPQ